MIRANRVANRPCHYGQMVQSSRMYTRPFESMLSDTDGTASNNSNYSPKTPESSSRRRHKVCLLCCSDLRNESGSVLRALVRLPITSFEAKFSQRRHDRLYLHGPHPRKTMVWNHGPPQNHGPEIPLCNHFYVLFYSRCQGRDFQDHGSEKVQTMVQDHGFARVGTMQV